MTPALRQAGKTSVKNNSGIFKPFNKGRSLLDQGIAAPGNRIVHIAGNGEKFSVVFHGKSGGNHCS